VRSPFSPNQLPWPNLTVSCYWLLRAEKAIDDMTRAEHIAVVPFRLAMRKSRRVNQPAASELLHDRDEALADERDRHRVGANAVASRAGCAWEALTKAGPDG
jgi:hypothetical protein